MSLPDNPHSTFFFTKSSESLFVFIRIATSGKKFKNKLSAQTDKTEEEFVFGGKIVLDEE